MSTIITLTSSNSSPWIVPSDWNSSSNTIECIGNGAGGAACPTLSGYGGAGGGGGGYANRSNITLTAGASITFSFGAGPGAGGVIGGATKGANGSSVSMTTGLPASIIARGGVSSSTGSNSYYGIMGIGGGQGGVAGTNTGTIIHKGGMGGQTSSDYVAISPYGAGGGAVGSSSADGATGGDNSVGAAGSPNGGGLNAVGGNGVNPGDGGGGGFLNHNGGAGAAGKIIITYTPISTPGAGAIFFGY